ncbi:MAG: tetraacyldisaccharide 4'-kinase [Parvibaculaceae bacterium]
MRSPAFWYPGRQPSFVATASRVALAPAALLYGMGARLRQRFTVPERVSVPVICVGNFTAGGAGKTPVSLTVSDRLRALGETPHFLSRGYGGSEEGPLQVDPQHHSSAEVGDEPLLLAAHGPAWIARERVAGAHAAEQAGATVILMDDGFQNPTLHKDLSLVVVDTDAGLGNGRVMPAGPLREPLAPALARTGALVALGARDLDAGLAAAAATSALPVLRARLAPSTEARARLEGRRVVAFAGIGRPEKFFATLREVKAEIVGTRAFADHHPFSEGDASALLTLARENDAALVTTEKDAVRLRTLDMAAGRDLLAATEILPVSAQFDDPAALDALLRTCLDAARASHTYAPPGSRSA